jgi:hypothetical protein
MVRTQEEWRTEDARLLDQERAREEMQLRFDEEAAQQAEWAAEGYPGTFDAWLVGEA